jgi:hypothetical protein
MYKTIILAVVLYGCGNWSLTLMELRRPTLFKNKVLRIFGPKKVEMIGGWRKLHNEELHNLKSSPRLIRMIKARRVRWAGHVARMGEMRNLCRILVGKGEGIRPQGRPMRRWEDNIKADLVEVGFSSTYALDFYSGGLRSECPSEYRRCYGYS